MAEQSGSAAPASTAKPASAAELSAAFPELVTAIRLDAATGERNRILGIEQHGTQMKGHEKLIADMKADANVTVEQAAVRILSAENAARASQLAGIKAVESETGKVNPAPKSGSEQPAGEKASTPDGWKTEYEGSDALKSEFASVDQYVAFKSAEASGRVKVLRQK